MSTLYDRSLEPDTSVWPVVLGGLAIGGMIVALSLMVAGTSSERRKVEYAECVARSVSAIENVEWCAELVYGVETEKPAPGKVVTLPQLKKKAAERKGSRGFGARGEEWRPEKSTKGEVVTPGKIAEIRRMRDEGANSATVAMKLGVSVGTVNKYWGD